VCEAPASWLPELLEVGLGEYKGLELAGTKHLKVYRERCGAGSAPCWWCFLPACTASSGRR